MSTQLLRAAAGLVVSVLVGASCTSAAPAATPTASPAPSSSPAANARSPSTPTPTASALGSPGSPGVSASPSTTPIADVPMYRVNAQRSGVHPGPVPTERPEDIWTFQAGNETHFNAVVANETVFVGSLDGNLYALDARTGTERWHFAGGGQITGSAAVADGIVYTPDGAGALVALDVASGAELWRANADMAVTGSSSPIVVDGVVYIPSADGHAYGFDALTGAERWSWAGTEPARGIAISDGVAYVGAEDRRLHAISLSDSRELWYVPTRSSAVSSSIVDGGTVYVSNLFQATVDTSELLAIDAPSGEVRWQFQAPTGLQVLPGAVADGALYVATADSGVYALAADDGTELWHADVPANLTAMAVVGDELFVTSTESEMIALRANDGGELWRIPIADGTDYGAAVTGASSSRQMLQGRSMRSERRPSHRGPALLRRLHPVPAHFLGPLSSSTPSMRTPADSRSRPAWTWGRMEICTWQMPVPTKFWCSTRTVRSSGVGASTALPQVSSTSSDMAAMTSLERFPSTPTGSCTWRTS